MTDDLRTTLAKAALDAAFYWPDNETDEPITWDSASNSWRENGYRIADSVISALASEGYLVGKPVSLLSDLSTVPDTSVYDAMYEASVTGEWERLEPFGLALIRIGGEGT